MSAVSPTPASTATATAQRPSVTPPTPLTHHQIVALVQPFTHAGYQVDLADSQRAQRRLAFKPVQRPGSEPGQAEVQEWLSLEVFASGSGCLTRTLVHPCGLRATVQASGADTSRLLARVQSVALQRQFTAAPGYTMARSYEVPITGSGSAASDSPPPAVFTAGEVRLLGLSLHLHVPQLRGVSADLELRAAPAPLTLPQDLLAVLGWNWARLIPTPLGWKSKLRLRGSPARRTARAEQALDLAARHMARTLDEPPAHFHDRHRRARLGVVFRRAIPALTPLVLVATILLMPRADMGPNPALWLLLYHVPTLLVVLSFCLQELPQLEIPPWPRRSLAPDWRVPAGATPPAAAVQRADT